MKLNKIRRKRHLAGLLAFAMMLVQAFPVSAFAADLEKQTAGGWKEAHFIWGNAGLYGFTEDPEGTSVKGFSEEGLKYYQQGHTDLELPDKATEIYKNAFAVGGLMGTYQNGEMGLTSVSGKNLVKIGKNAFKNEGSQDGKTAFKGNNIQTINCPALKEIAAGAFANVFGNKAYSGTYKTFTGNEISDLSGVPNLQIVGEKAFENEPYSGFNQNIEIEAYKGNAISFINPSWNTDSDAFAGQIVTLYTNKDNTFKMSLSDTKGNTPVVTHDGIKNNGDGTYTVQETDQNIVLGDIRKEFGYNRNTVSAGDKKASWYITIDVSGKGGGESEIQPGRIFKRAILKEEKDFNFYEIQFENPDQAFLEAITNVSVNNQIFEKQEKLTTYAPAYTVHNGVLEILSFDLTEENDVVISSKGYKDTVFTFRKVAEDLDKTEWLEKDFTWENTTVTGFSEAGLKKHNAGHSDIVFPDRATEIGTRAFQNVNERKHHIDSIKGKHIAVIGERAFWNTLEEKNLDEGQKMKGEIGRASCRERV